LSGATRPRPHRVSIAHPLYGKGHAQTRKILIAIQRSDQKLWLVRTVTLAWCDQTSSSPSIDSTSTIWKKASRNSWKTLIEIQRSDQKLWPVRTVTLARRDPTSSSPSIESTSSIWKRASRNSCIILVTIQRRMKSYGPFEPFLLHGATRPPPHRVSIPHPLYGKGHPQTYVKF
jgi:hypothetical protein